MFVSYWNIKSDLQTIATVARIKPCSSSHTKEITLFVLKILSFLTVIFPLVFMIGYFAQRNIEKREEEEIYSDQEDIDVMKNDSSNKRARVFFPEYPDKDFSVDYSIDNIKEEVEKASLYSPHLDCQYWVMIYPSKEESMVKYRERGKFHISLHRSLDNLKKALPIICRIIKQEGGLAAKFSNFSERIFPRDNPFGKEAVIYLHNQSHKDALRLIDRFDRELYDAGVLPGGDPDGDVPLTNSGLIHTRIAHTFLGLYFRGNIVLDHGFTRGESLSIGEESLLVDCTKTKPFGFVDFDLVISDKTDFSERLFTSFQDSLFTKDKINEGVYHDDVLYKTLVGSETKIHMYHVPDSLIRIMAPTYYRQVLKGNIGIMTIDRSFFNDSLFKEIVFQSILEDVSIQVAHQYTKRKITEGVRPGSLLPGFLLGVIKPLFIAFKDKTELSKKDLTNYLTTHRELIIRYLVSSALRDRSKLQLRSDEPILLGS